MNLLCAVALTGAVDVWAVARRARVAVAVVSYSLPRLVTTVAGAAVEFDLVDVLAAALALAAAFAFFGGIVTIYCADVRATSWDVGVEGFACRNDTSIARREAGKLERASNAEPNVGKERSAHFGT